MIFILLVIIFILAGIVGIMARRQKLEQDNKGPRGRDITVIRKALLTPKRQQEDLFKDELFQQIKMPLVRIKARREYNCREIQREIAAQLNSPPLP